MCEKEVLIKRLMETLNEGRSNKNGKQKADKRKNINLAKTYH